MKKVRERVKLDLVDEIKAGVRESFRTILR
jgi:hypothetical protein